MAIYDLPIDDATEIRIRALCLNRQTARSSSGHRRAGRACELLLRSGSVVARRDTVGSTPPSVVPADSHRSRQSRRGLPAVFESTLVQLRQRPVGQPETSHE